MPPKKTSTRRGPAFLALLTLAPLARSVARLVCEGDRGVLLLDAFVRSNAVNAHTGTEAPEEQRELLRSNFIGTKFCVRGEGHRWRDFIV